MSGLDGVFWKRLFSLGDKSSLFAAVAEDEADGSIHLTLTSDSAADLVLHWGVCEKNKHDWVLPEEDLWTAATEPIKDGIAVEDPFIDCSQGGCDYLVGGVKVPVQQVTLKLPAVHAFFGLTFVLRSKDGTKWWKDGHRNFLIPLPGGPAPAAEEDVKDELLRDLIDAERSQEWTLMHRYNKTADLLRAVLHGDYGADRDGRAAALYTVLRYSSTRQLTWQRSYNTQPRILSAAQDRLTHALAAAHAETAGEAQQWVRQMLTCVGRGGDGQRIRDEILHIMHRHRIPERKGTWMEEWHQKLHNNTTPDDVGICEAYLAFLESGGDPAAYWRVLSDHGISRERLESFDRPVRCEPEDFPHIRGPLIHDFREYLRCLKSVHSGADLQSSAAAVSGRLPEAVRGHLGYVLGHIGQPQVLPFIEASVAARTALQPAVTGDRDMLYLDLALEQAIRSAAEQGVGQAGSRIGSFIGPLLENLCLSTGDNEELCYCLKAWQSLPPNIQDGEHMSKQEALQASAAMDRLRRAVADQSDAMSERLQPLADVLGGALDVDRWAVELFAEETVRGSPAFPVSLALSALDPVFRKVAELGSWQVISPVEAAVGRLLVVPELHSLQEHVYQEPTLLLAAQVTGEEEIPEGCVGVITPDSPDVLSHISVRARNTKALLATCFERGPLEELEQLDGAPVQITTTARGDVAFEPRGESALRESQAAQAEDGGPGKAALRISVPEWGGRWAVGMDAFRDGVVGAKSKNLAGLRGKVPAWIRLPGSVTVPFATFERCLEEKANATVAKELEALARQVHEGVLDPAEGLARCRELALGVQVPQALHAELAREMAAAGVEWPEGGERWHAALEALKAVWASKYNLRAFVSLRKQGLNFDAVRMAVLVQRLVDAEYAFVIHTANPATGDAGEVYIEVVKGLGEVLVGNYPGRAFSFTVRKDAVEEPHVEAFPSKSVGLFLRESLIFRSDSNGEDLEGYAGAGLYDSVPMDAPVERPVDYSGDRLMTDPAFQQALMVKIAKVGLAIEDALGSAQDVEGCVTADGEIVVVQTRPQV